MNGRGHFYVPTKLCWEGGLKGTCKERLWHWWLEYDNCQQDIMATEKAFDMPWKVLEALRSPRVNEWAVRIIQDMYSNVWSHVWVNGQYSEELVGIRTLSLAYCSLSWCWKCFHVPHWCAMGPLYLMACVSPSSRPGRLIWKENRSMSTWRPCFWSPVLALMSLRNLTSTPLLSTAVVLATAPLWVHSASCRSTRGAAASLIQWPTPLTKFAPGVTTRPGPLTIDQWLKWMSMAPCLIWRPLSPTWVTCCAPVVAVTMPLPPDVVCPGKSSGLQWRHNDNDGVSNHQPHSCLLNRLFRHRSKKTSKLRVTGLCVGNSPGPVNSPHKGPVTRKMFPFDDVIMGNSCLFSPLGTFN